MKNFFIFYLAFFLIASIFGFVKGKKDLNDPKFLEKYIFNQASLANINCVEFILYYKGADTIFVFNVDNDSLIILNRQILQHSNKDTVHSKNTYKDFNEKISGFQVKGFISTLSIKKLMKIEDMESPKAEILGSIIGILSGYGVGYKIATKSSVPDEKSDIYRKILLDKEKWISAKLTLLNWLYNECYVNVKMVEDEKVRKKLQNRLINFRNALRFDNGKLRIHSITFKRLIDLHGIIISNTSLVKEGLIENK